MAFQAELYICHSLRQLLAPLSVGDALAPSEALRDILLTLERWLSDVLADHFPAWRYESFDGFPYLKTASKTGHNEIELGGLCYLMSQVLTPFLFTLRISEAGDALAYLHCPVGERVDGRLVGRPLDRWARQLQRLDLATIDWAYDLELGE